MKFYNNFKNLMSTYKQHFVDTVGILKILYFIENKKVPSNY